MFISSTRLVYVLAVVVAEAYAQYNGQTFTQDWSYQTGQFSSCSASTNQQCGPAGWGSKYPTCTQKSTSQQSPIDIVSAPLDDTLPTPQFVTLNGGCFTWTQFNTLIDIYIDLTQPNAFCNNLYMQYEGMNWVMQEVAFKSPSEHTIGGGHYDAEAQFLHINPANGHKAMVAVFMMASSNNFANNSFLDAIWRTGASALTPVPNSITVTPAMINDDFSPYTDFMPGSKGHFQYIGSNTEPPCDEDVDWFVFKDPVPISKTDLSIIRSVVANIQGNYLSQTGNNNRPTQSGLGSIQTPPVVKFTDGTTIFGVSTPASATTQSITAAMQVATAGLVIALFAFVLAGYNFYLLSKSHHRAPPATEEEYHQPAKSAATTKVAKKVKKSKPAAETLNPILISAGGDDDV